MTTEEKAKAYDEALEWMKKVYPTLTGAAKEDAEYYFPELKESLDLIHREWILEYLYEGLKGADEQLKEQFKSAINWLENIGRISIGTYRNAEEELVQQYYFGGKISLRAYQAAQSTCPEQLYTEEIVP